MARSTSQAGRLLRRPCERGTVMFVSLVTMVAVMAITGAFLSVVLSKSNTEVSRLNVQKARQLADAGVGLGISRLNAKIIPTGMNRDEFRPSVPPADGGYVVWTQSTGEPDRFGIDVEATVQVETAKVFVVVQRDREPLQGGLRGAITARGDVSTLGSIVVNGNDHTETGVLTGDPGLYGVSSKMTISIGGASTVGGNGEAPSGSESASNTEEAAAWGDGTDANGNGVIDPWEKPYPDTPDQVLDLPEGTLKQMAIETGTYFQTEGDFQTFMAAYKAANGGKVPGGVVIYCDFELIYPLEFGTEFNDKPTVFVQHMPAGNARMKDIHGKFRGLIISDLIEHLNGDFVLLGGIFSLAADNLDTTLGNGNAYIGYSSAVMSSLPDDPTRGAGFFVISYREEIPN